MIKYATATFSSDSHHGRFWCVGSISLRKWSINVKNATEKTRKTERERASDREWQRERDRVRERERKRKTIGLMYQFHCMIRNVPQKEFE
jgi:hypothetical protein